MFLHLEFFLNILLSVVLIAIFICVFFFTYAKNIEKKIIVNQTKELVYDLSSDILQFKPIKDSLKGFAYKLKSPDMDEQNRRVENANKLLIEKTINLIIVSAVIVFTIVFFLTYIFNLSFAQILIPNIVILLFVGLTEFIFLRYIAYNYISFDPNYAKYSIIKTLEDYAYNR